MVYQKCKFNWTSTKAQMGTEKEIITVNYFIKVKMCESRDKTAV